MRKTKPFLEDFQAYHVFSRAVDGRTIFGHDDDSYRFIFQMYVTNYGSPGVNLHRKDMRKAALSLLNGEEIPKSFISREGKPLVQFLSFAEVGNHYHFLLLPNREDGIPRYMQKLNTAFARYFNLKHSRKGTLFESKYKVVSIESETQLDAIIRYINVKNPLDVYQPGWRKEGLKNEKEGWSFLFEYPFSSFPDIFGKRRSKLIAQEPLRSQFLDREFIYGKKGYAQFLQESFQKSAAVRPDIFL